MYFLREKVAYYCSVWLLDGACTAHSISFYEFDVSAMLVHADLALGP